MPTEREVEMLTELSHRYCAVISGEDQQRTGRFVLKQGKNQRTAKSARAPLVWTTEERTTAELLRRVRELASNGEGHVFVCAFEADEDGKPPTNPTEVVRIVGTTDGIDGDDDIPVGAGAIENLTYALVKTNAQLLSDNRELLSRQIRRLDTALDEREQMTMLAMHAASLEGGLVDQRWRDTLQALTPTVEAAAPRMVEILGAWLGKGGVNAALPTEPGPRFAGAVERMIQLANELGAIIRAHPEVQTVDSVAPLVGLAHQLGSALGFKVVPNAEEPHA